MFSNRIINRYLSNNQINLNHKLTNKLNKSIKIKIHNNLINNHNNNKKIISNFKIFKIYQISNFRMLLIMFLKVLLRFF